MNEVKLCKHCRSEIDKKAKVCPYCQKKQKSGVGCLGTIAILVILFIFVPSYRGYKINEQKRQEVHNSVSVNDDTPSTTQAEIKDESKVLYDKDGLTITYKGIEYGSFTTKVNLLIENSTGKDITVQTRDLSVNGYMVSDVFSCDVLNGKKANDHISIITDKLEENNIKYEDISNIEFKIHYFDSKTWTDNVDTEMLSINFGD